jgi:TP901 family phage tail tape measure protein
VSLDLGALVGHVIIESAAAEGKITTLLRQFSQLGAQAETAAGGTAVLDRNLVGVATAATQAAAGLDRTTAATRATTTSEERAATVAATHAQAVTRVGTAMTFLAGTTEREQAAVLRAMAAQERYDAVLASGTATTRQLAAAQAALIGAQRGVVAAQEAAAVTASRWRTALGGVAKTAAGLGLIIGVLAAAKAAIDITKEANDFQRSMVQIQTNASVTRQEVDRASGALLNLAGPTAAAPEELAVAFYHAKAVGLDYAKALNTTKIAAEGAKVGHADLEQTMNALTATVASGIPGVEDMSGAMGQLIGIVGTGDMKLKDLNEALGSGILTVVKGYGLSLTDVGAALATFGDNNIRGADAATMLRMAVQAMAVPAVAGRDRLHELGLTTNQLAVDMQQGGLNKAVLDLKAHLDAAGVSSVQVGAILTEIFGKRAGPGLAVLIGQVDRLQSKFAILRDSGATFGDKWKATTETASFALASLRAKLEAAGIVLTEKLGPAIADAANWLGTVLPHAVGTLQSILSPLEHEVGSLLVGAWHGLSTVLTVVGTALEHVGTFLEHNKTLIRDIVTPLLVLWATFKAYTIAVFAFRAIQTAIVLTRVRLLELRATGAGVGATLAAGLSPAMIAVTAIGLALGAAVLHSNKHSDALQRERAEMDQLTDAIKADSGALGANTLQIVKSALETSGAFKAARELGVSLGDVTLAAMGHKDAMQRVTEGYGLTAQMQRLVGRLTDDDIRRLSKSTDATDRRMAAVATLNNALGENNVAVHGAVQAAKDSAEADKEAAAAAANLAPKTEELTQYSKDLKRANEEAHVSIDGVTYAMRGQATEADVLNAAIARLSGDKNAVAESQLALMDSLSAITEQIKAQAKQYKDHGTSMSANTVEGRKNLEWLHQQIDQINAIASAQIKAGASTETVTGALGDNEKALRKAAVAAGLDADQVNVLLKRYAATPAEVKTLIVAQTDEAGTKALAIEKKLHALEKKRTALILLRGKANNRSDAQDLSAAIAAVDLQIDALTDPRTLDITLAVHKAGAVNAITGALQGPGYASGGPITGPGPKGVDSVPFIGAPGEWVMKTAAVDKYGPAMFAAMNAGTYRPAAADGPSIRIPTAAPALQMASSSSSIDNRRYVTIQSLDAHQEFPRPGGGPISMSHAMVAAEHAMGGLGGS